MLTNGVVLVCVDICRIYPNGRGHYAIGSPDGKVLRPGQALTIVVAGHEITGTIQASEQGDYLRTDDGTTCGLCAGMRVIPTIQDRAPHLLVEDIDLSAGVL